MFYKHKIRQQQLVLLFEKSNATTNMYFELFSFFQWDKVKNAFYLTKNN